MKRHPGKNLWYIIPILGLVVAIYYYPSQSSSPCYTRIVYQDTEDLLPAEIEQLFARVDSNELEEVWNEWQSFDAYSTSSNLLTSLIYYQNRTLDVWQHTAEENIHYGVVILPNPYDTLNTYPLLLWANGLDQRNPLISMDESGFFQRLTQFFPGHIIVIPSYRGQVIEVGGEHYCSDGFFGDAYDGATDDALRLLTLVKSIYPVDESKISTFGISRGGTVALLSGIRDSSIRSIVSQSGPSLFHNQLPYEMYGFQFKYQFLSRGSSIREIRKKLMRCSPAYFINRYPRYLLLVHGKNDPIVPFEQALLVQEQAPSCLDTIYTEDEHGVYKMAEISKWIIHNDTING